MDTCSNSTRVVEVDLHYKIVVCVCVRACVCVCVCVSYVMVHNCGFKTVQLEATCHPVKLRVT